MKHRWKWALGMVGTLGLVGVLVSTRVGAIMLCNALGAYDCGGIPGTTENSMENLRTALIMFHLDNRRYPTTEEGLEALVHAPAGTKRPGRQYVDRVPMDAWDNPFRYYSPGRRRVCAFELRSLGPDGMTGRDFSDDDIIHCEKKWRAG